MRHPIVIGALAAVAALAAAPAVGADAETERRLYVIATSHLDTQWRWTVRDAIDDFLPATLRDNFAMFEKYPDYAFSFEGAFRYALAREYYPAEYERLKAYVASGRWRVAGSWVDAVDPNIPSPESLFRHALYGNGFFRREFGVTSRDVFLPDCFGFGLALPSIAAHSGLAAFSTQKLTWGSSVRIPFDVGLWEGVDGSTLVASINPGDYSADLKGNLTLDPEVYAMIDRQRAMSGVPAGVRYFGTGDVGVAPLEPSVALLQESVRGPGPLRVVSAAPDQLARDLASGDVPGLSGLQRYRGEFLLTSHGAGCYTSQAAMKRYNRLNQRLADAAERAAVAAAWLAGPAYPREALREAWVRFLWHQFHDDLTGTSVPEAYTLSWNDEVVAANQFADVLDVSVAAVASALDTRTDGHALVVYNPLAIEREDVVEAVVRFPDGAPPGVRVTGPDGRVVPAQLSAAGVDRATVTFVARVAPVSFSVFAVEPVKVPAPAGELAVDRRTLSNDLYRVTLDESGDIVSVFDTRIARELLAAPLRLQLFGDEPRRWAAWEVEYSALSAPPREEVGGPAEIRVVEDGPARVAVEVVRRAGGSTFTQRIRLAAGTAGDRVEVLTDIDWRSAGTLLKAAFPLAAANPLAVYDLGLGVAERGSNRPNLYEVPAQTWADITDASGAFGVAVLNDSRHGWDKPDGRTLRLTLVHTPAVVKSWSWLDDQASNDLGRHRVLTALAGHRGDWREGRVPEAADRLNRPLLAWQVPSHPGALGRAFSLLRVEGGEGGATPIAVRAVKFAEESDEVIVRLFETSGRPVQGATLRFARPVAAVREVNAAEEPLEGLARGGALPGDERPPLALRGGAVVLDFEPFRPRTLALRLAPGPLSLEPSVAVPLDLPYDRDGISRDEDRRDGDFDGDGHTIAGELLPATLTSGGVPFRTGPQQPGRANVMSCRGQSIELPRGSFDHLLLLVSAVGGDRPATFVAGASAVTRLVPDWSEPVGQWNSRMVGGAFVGAPDRIAPAYAKAVPLAFVGTHRHGPRGENQAYVFTYLFRIALPLPPGATTVTLPDDPALRVLAAAAVRFGDAVASPAQSVHDPSDATVVHVHAPRRLFLESTSVALTSPNPGAVIRYTLDGTDPDGGSRVYRAPIAVDRTATLKARAFAPGLDDRFVASASLTRATPRRAAHATPAGMAPGVSCRVYEGEWRDVPDFTGMTPARTVTLAALGLPRPRPEKRFAMVCDGLLSVPATGVYTLSLRSEAGSELWLGDERVLAKTNIDFTDTRADVALEAGLHPIEVRYVQRRSVMGLELRMDGPDHALAPVPDTRYFHRP
ncbi:MAG: glycoside hydrolase family 38 C-terminal domain-containing protein [Acidobacteriota bacterium]